MSSIHSDAMVLLIPPRKITELDRCSMNFVYRFSTLCMFVVGFYQSSTESASGQSLPQPVRGTPIKLFDGSSLKGWAKQNGDPSKNWIVDEGAISWKSSGGDLYHEHWYRDFELTFQWKLGPNGNSGIKYRVQPYGKRFLGCEYQVFDDKQDLFSRQSTGCLYALFEPSKNKVNKPLGKWNKSKILVCGNHVEHWLNGTKVVDAVFGSPDWIKRVANSKFNKYDDFGLNREGRIFLQDHGKPVWFREIVVTPLDCDCPATTTVCEQSR